MPMNKASWPVPEVCEQNAKYLFTVCRGIRMLKSSSDTTVSLEYKHANPTDVYLYKDATNHSLIFADEWTTYQNTYGSVPLEIFLSNFDDSQFSNPPFYYREILAFLIERGIVERKGSKLRIVEVDDSEEGHGYINLG